MSKHNMIDQMRLTLDELVSAGLVEREGDGYRISQKGKEIIELYDSDRLKQAVDSHFQYVQDFSLKV